MKKFFILIFCLTFLPFVFAGEGVNVFEEGEVFNLDTDDGNLLSLESVSKYNVQSSDDEEFYSVSFVYANDEIVDISRSMRKSFLEENKNDLNLANDIMLLKSLGWMRIFLMRNLQRQFFL